MPSQYEQDAESRMKKSLEALQKELSRIRTGRASPALLDGVRVESYGTTTPLKQVAAIAVPDPKMITVSPWDKSLISAVEKAIQAADLGLNPIKDKNIVRLPIPALTEERRKELAKQCSKLSEEGKISIRNIRRDINESIKKAEKSKELSEDNSHTEMDKVQRATDRFIKEVEQILSNKEKEILAV